MSDQRIRASKVLKLNQNNTPLSSNKEAPYQGPLALDRGLTTIRAFVRKAQIANSDEAQRRTKVEWAQRIWDEGWAISGTLADVFLLSHGIVFDGAYPEAIRFHPSIAHEPTRTRYPALIAAVTDLDGQFVGIHRVYLEATGRCLASVPYGHATRMLGEWAGNYIHLSEKVEKKLVVAESLETALTIQRACPELPVWAAITPGNMRSPVPKHVQEIILCPDQNKTNPRPAERRLGDAVRTHQKAGHRVLLAPPPQGLSFNDLLMAECTRGMDDGI